MTELRAAGADVMAVSTERPEVQAALVEKAGLTFQLLSDADRALISALDLRHEGGNPFEEGAIARPAVLIVTGGVIHQRYATDNWRVRETGSALAAALKRLP